jgi:arginyl-tRNA--protein-N-Asp/Glu arginylyltransferase
MNQRELPPVIQLYNTASYPCSYLAQTRARSQVAAPAEAIDSQVYSELVQLGFRRSGHYAYRPHCDHCHACVPVRIPIAHFHPTRSQRRAWQQHQSLRAEIEPLHYEAEHFNLYQMYQQTRHPGGGMDEDDIEHYRQFFLTSNVDSRLLTFHDHDQLKMVSLIDVLSDGLSAVYTFFDPAPHTSYGVFNILFQIELARELNLPYVYLGYWIAQSPKMSYKAHYHPIEGLIDGVWQPLRPPADTTA